MRTNEPTFAIRLSRPFQIGAAVLDAEILCAVAKRLSEKWRGTHPTRLVAPYMQTDFAKWAIAGKTSHLNPHSKKAPQFRGASFARNTT